MRWVRGKLGSQRRGSLSSEGRVEQSRTTDTDFEWSPRLHGEAGLELWGRSSHQEAVAGVQREMMAAWTRLLAVGIERSGSFPRELGGIFVRIEEPLVVGGKGSCRMCARLSGFEQPGRCRHHVMRWRHKAGPV